MSNTFGEIFKVTTFGESHGKLIGVIIDGCPSNLEISEEEINIELKKRRPNLNEYVSQRNEFDFARIVSGVFEGKTTGAPICIVIENNDVKSSAYDEIINVLRPSHANYTYLKKYKIFDHRGASRASGRETALRVAAGAIAKKILKRKNIKVFAYLKSLGNISADIDYNNLSGLDENSIYCPDLKAEKMMLEKLLEIKNQKDSIGGIVEFYIDNVPVGIGEPIYDKLNARLAYALMSIPSAKGFEIGDGFESVNKRGSYRNDVFEYVDDQVRTITNNEGGILAGISNGMPIIGRVVFKPAATIGLPINTIDIYGNKVILKYEDDSRHDACIAIRATPVVEAMCALTIVDFILLNQTRILNDEEAKSKTEKSFI
ncbi:MAG: chorismate synthase [Parachlamydiales bacterium]|jgi:chorismate synthase